MSENNPYDPLIRKCITEHCLITADIDKTILAQTTGEHSHFLQQVAPKLINSAEMGMKLAFLAGNSMSQVTNRFLKWLLNYLCNTNSIQLLPQFHFFCNSGGVYFHFPNSNELITDLLINENVAKSDLFHKIFEKFPQANQPDNHL
jgi:hypothetical protein